MKIKIFLLGLIKFILDYTVKPVLALGWRIYYRNIDRSGPLPKCKNPLLFQPAWLLAQRIRKREITSLEVVQAFIQRIKEVQPYLNCVVYPLYDEAIEEAKKVDQILSMPNIPEAYSEKNAPILGVPYSCKESVWVKGKPNSAGSVKRRDVRAPQDATVVKYMRQAGGIMTCLTNTSELCMWFESSNYLYGTSRNPYNLSRLVGGSSGGEGCIVGSGASVMGIGADIGGSIRMPAFFNGVYGHKPSSMVIPNEYQHPPASGIQNEMLGTGPICRYASDLKLFFRIFSGPKYEERMKKIAPKFESDIDLRKLKYYVIRDLQGNLLVTKPSRDQSQALEKAVDFIENTLNVQVKEIKSNKLKLAFQIWSSMMNNGKENEKDFSKLLNDSDVPINPYKELLKSIFCSQTMHTLPALGLAIVERFKTHDPELFVEIGNKLRSELKAELGDDGILIFPSFPVVAPYHNIPLFTNSLDFVYYGIINALGFPSTQCPMGLSSDALPTGVQIVSNHLNDHLTIKVAELLESQLIGWVPPF